MKFSEVVRERFRGPAYGQDFTTWLAKVQHGFRTAQIPESAQVDHLVAYLESPAQELAISFKKKYESENVYPDRPSAAVAKKYHEDELAALIAHLKTQSLVVGTRPAAPRQADALAGRCRPSS